MREVSWNWAGEIDSNTIDAWVRNIENRYELEEGIIIKNSGGEPFMDNTYRSSKIAFVKEKDFPKIWKKATDYYLAANKAAYGFNLVGIESCQYGVYDSVSKDFYNEHADTLFPGTNMVDRKISMTIQLSDPGDYEGGDLLFNAAQSGIMEDLEYRQALKKKGSIITFPSFFLHSVTPVTKGVRKSLVFWVEGPDFI
jgi:PKHD-type hydroxylase